MDYNTKPIEITSELVKSALPKRHPEANKGSFGHLLSVCGSMMMPGAAVLAASAAVRMGAGLVTAAFPTAAYNAIAPHLIEPLLCPLQSDENGFLSARSTFGLIDRLERATACLIGCGLGQTPDTQMIVKEILLHSKKPIVLDADGINVITDNINILNAVSVPVIITPHPGEMSRLCKVSIKEIQQDRVGVSLWFAEKSKTIVVLKGAGTIIATPDGKCYVNRTGNAGMAKGGSGDMLAGMIASLTAQGLSPETSAICAVYLHGVAGDLAASQTSQRGVTPSDMVSVLPKLLSEYE
ncbi:MAG: NAD(P)H-hydrate dehydratase [Clostridia bacterium]|nr:NAD(P)H-hydrate dehydratase [Clostridia bacterium]